MFFNSRGFWIWEVRSIRFLLWVLKKPLLTEISPAESYLLEFSQGTSPISWNVNAVILMHDPLGPAERAWLAFGSQSWVRSGGFEPTNANGKSVLHHWLDPSVHKLYVCKVPVKCRSCNISHHNQNGALARVRAHLNSRSYECNGKYGTLGW